MNLTTSAKSALLLQEDGTLRLVDTHTLADLQTWDVAKLPSPIDVNPRTR